MSEHIGSIAGPEYVAKVNRVLEAARAWRGSINLQETATIRQALMKAIDALDAPRERYIISGSDVMCNNTIYDTIAGREVSMLEACRALNAAVRKP